MLPEAALSAPLPLLVIGGYLGAGKTTLVNHLLRQADGRRIAVLVNDFGDINIDADLIEATAGDGAANSAGVLSLAGGCLCCSFGDDLVGTLVALTRRAPAPDLVLIELSGVALPAAVLRTARLAPGIEIAGTLVVADAGDLRRQAADRYVGDTVRQQLADADWVVLNNPDLADAAGLAALQTWLDDPAGPAPQARVLACAVHTLPAELVLGWRAVALHAEHGVAAAGGFATDAEALARLAAQPIGARARAGEAAHPLFESRSQRLPPGTDLAALGAALTAPGSGVLRAKALVSGADGLGQLLQVAGGRWAVTPARVRGAGHLVAIGLRGQLPSTLPLATDPEA